MLDPDYVEKMTESKWIENLTPDSMPERFTGDNYRVKDDAPEEFKKEWEEFIKIARLYI